MRVSCDWGGNLFPGTQRAADWSRHNVNPLLRRLRHHGRDNDVLPLFRWWRLSAWPAFISILRKLSLFSSRESLTQSMPAVIISFNIGPARCIMCCGKKKKKATEEPRISEIMTRTAIAASIVTINQAETGYKLKRSLCWYFTPVLCAFPNYLCYVMTP